MSRSDATSDPPRDSATKARKLTLPSSRKRLGLIGVLVTLGIIGAALVIIQTLHDTSIDAFRTATTNLTNGMTQQVRQTIGMADQDLRDLQGELTSVAGSSPEPVTAAFGTKAVSDSMARRRRRLLGIESLAIIDAHGQLANSSEAWPPPPLDLSAQDIFRHFRDTDDREAFIGEPVPVATGRWSAPLARRLEDAGGTFLGVAVANLSFAYFEDFFATAMPAQRRVSLVRRDGMILLQYPTRGTTGRQVPEDHPWYRIVAQGGGAYQGPGFFDPAPMIAVVRPLRGLPLVVTASVSESDALSNWTRQRVWTVLGSAAAIIANVLLLRFIDGQFDRLERSERDIAARNRELEIARRHVDDALSNIHQGVCFFDGNKKLLISNRRFAEIYALPPEAIRPGMPLQEIVELRYAAGSFPNTTTDTYMESWQFNLAPGAMLQKVVELANGRTIQIHFKPTLDGGWVATHEDITERRQAEARIAFLARHDVLTGLANRALFEERLDRAVATMARGIPFAIMFLDLDRFKAVNDTLGHQVGDALLCAVAARLEGCVRDVDTVARLGGDEFVILQHGAAVRSDAERLAERILAAFRAPWPVAGHDLTAATSIGIALAPQDGTTPAILLRHADDALYAAKRKGRGTYRFFEESMSGAQEDIRFGLPVPG